jgi:hypothetical protein
MCAGALPHTRPSGPTPQDGPSDHATAATPRRRTRTARAPCPRYVRGSWPTGGPRRGAPTFCVRHALPPPSHTLGRSSEPPYRIRRRRRPKLVCAPHRPPPVLEFKHHISLHRHPLDPPVHVHWPADSPACRHCGRSGRPPPSTPPAVAGVVSGQADPTNRSGVSPNPTLAAHSPESGPSSQPAGLAPPPGTSLRGLQSFQGPRQKEPGV